MAGRTAASLRPAILALLFLIVGLVGVAADPHLANADIPEGMMRRALTTTSDTACATELAACVADASCVACFEAFDLQLSECGIEEGITPCDEVQERFCCTLEEEDEDCEGNTTFLEFVECSFEEGNPQCDSYGVDFDECNGASGLYHSSWGMASVAASVAVVGILATAYNFVV